VPTGQIHINDQDHDLVGFFANQQNDPMPLFEMAKHGWWAFRGNFIKCDPKAEGFFGRERLTMLIKHRVLREEQRWAKIERDIEAFENFDRLPALRREPIPRSVRLFVWQRDEGKCVECGSQADLEYDHLIPVVKGGANTERNIRLLCEPCNRRKGANI
jgi:hypothetical protein